MYRSLNLDPRAKGSYFNLNHDLIKFKSTCLLQYEEKLLPDNLTKAHGWLVMMKTFFFVSLSLLPLSNLSLSLRWAPASAWKAGDPDSIPGRSPGEDPGELQSTGLQRVKLDWMTNIFTSPRTALQSLLLYIHTTETYDVLSYVLGKAHQMWRSTSRKNMGAGARHVTSWILTTCFTSLGLIFCSSLKKIKQHLMPLSSYKNGKETWDKRWLRSIVFFFKNRNIFFAKY